MNEPDRRRAPGERAGLTRERVLAAAWRIAERDGLERVTMRRLADELGVLPNALYSHIPNKSALIDELLDELLGRIELPDPETVDWRDGLIALMDSGRRLLLEHPAFLPAIIARSQVGPNALRLGEATLELLRRGGVEGDRAVDAFRALLTHMFGSAAIEAPRRAEPDPAGRRARAEAAFSAEDLPNVRRLAAQLAQPPTGESFATGLRWLLTGIAAE